MSYYRLFALIIVFLPCLLAAPSHSAFHRLSTFNLSPTYVLATTPGSVTAPKSSHPECLSFFAARHSRQSGRSRKMIVHGYLFC
ncbi:hypothetical protein F4604DRAFT_1747435 [Suillus subluteus]|nr:hypothetical protein F4604DRAFT_1747435 [Suillus subluteus]